MTFARTTLPALLLPALLTLAACKGHDAEPKVTQAWVKLPAVPGQPAAAYFTIHGGSGNERLVRIETTLAKRTDMHSSMMDLRNMASMAPIAGIDVPRRATISFAPGGNHAMIYGLDPVVVPGTAVPLRFGFASGKTAEAEAKSVAAGDSAPY
jgi:copper(I)-binding protein